MTTAMAMVIAIAISIDNNDIEETDLWQPQHFLIGVIKIKEEYKEEEKVIYIVQYFLIVIYLLQIEIELRVNTY